MTTEEREQVRLSLLRYLDANAGRKFGLTTAVMAQMLTGDGLACSREEAEAELAYLRDKGLIRRQTKLVSPELAAWEITAEGRDFYARF